MSLKRRLTLYLIGLALGLFVVIFLFDAKQTSFSYLPNARVLKNIMAKPIVLEDTLLSHDLMGLLEKGAVDFSKSQIDREKPCNTYHIEAKHILFMIENCTDTAWVRQLIR